MDWYFENGYITDFDKVKYIQNTFQSSLLNMEKINPKNNFGILYDFEIEVINKYQSPYKPLTQPLPAKAGRFGLLLKQPKVCTL